MAIPIAENSNNMVKALVGSINSLSNDARAKYGEATGQSLKGLEVLKGANPSASTAKMRGYGANVADIAGGLSGYSDTIRGLAGDLADTSNILKTSGTDSLGIGSDLSTMNRSSSNELVRALLGNIDKYNPENLVSFAAQDVNSAYDISRGQLIREMSRTGVNPSSGRSNTLQQQFQIALNTALAAAKTRARMYGLESETNVLKTLAGIGQSYTNQGNSTLTSAANVMSNAINAQNAAASIDSTSASLFGSAASIEGSATNINLGYAGSVASQNNTIASMLQREGAQLDEQAARELSFYNARLAEDAYYARVKANNATDVYTDIHGNKIFSNGGKVAVVNKTDSGFVVDR